MNQQNTPNGRVRKPSFLLNVAAAVVVVAGLRAAAPVLQPLLLALFLAMLSLPLLQGLQRLRISTGFAVLITVTADLAVLTLLGFLLSGAVNEFAKSAPGLIEQLVNRVRDSLALVEERGIMISKWVAVEPLEPGQYVDVLGGLLGGTVKGVASAVSYVILVTVALTFVFLELTALPGKLHLALGEGSDPTKHFASVTREVQRYLGIKTLVSAVTGVLIGSWVAVLGIDFPLFWGLAMFLLNYIPVLGPFIVGFPAVLLTLVQHGWLTAALLGLGFLVTNVVLGNLVEPHLMGRSFGISAMVVFTSLLFWGWVWGPLGMILSVPLTIVIKIILEHTERWRWVAVLLGPGPKQTRAVAAPSDA